MKSLVGFRWYLMVDEPSSSVEILDLNILSTITLRQ
jgi:hypothetical protein